jgi:two-component system, chemotaxis family, sensor kinase Cph1
MLDDLDDRALDQLPFGVVCLDDKGKVVRMNRTESEASGIQRWRALGRDFFREVAPGPANRLLADHVRAFAAGTRPQPIRHTFRRRAGADTATIELLPARRADRVYLCIRR